MQTDTQTAEARAGSGAAGCSAASLDLQEMFLECVRAGYRLLMRGDVMREGDESLRLHDRQWLPLPSGWGGHPWDSKHWPPVRRKDKTCDDCGKPITGNWNICASCFHAIEQQNSD